MKIALCLEYPIAQAGGVSVLVLTLVRELAAEHDVFLVSPDDAASLAAAGLDGVIRGHFPWLPQHAAAVESQRLADQLSRAGVNLAHFHFGGNFGWSNRWPGRCPIPEVARRGIIVVTTIHMAVGLLHGYCGPQKPLAIKLALLPFAWINKMRVLRSVTREVTVSRQDWKRLCCWYWPVRKKFQPIYHSRIAGDEATPHAAVPRDNVILGVGHLARRKGQLVLAQAFALLAARYPDWNLHLVGHVAEAATEQALAACARQLPPGRMQLLGQRGDTKELMRRAAIYVQPSFHEGLPLSLQEALWNGCACVATDIPGNIELIQHGRNGLLTPPGDPAALARVLEQLIQDEKLRQRFATAGRIAIETLEMTRPQMTRNHLKLYGELITKT